MSEIELFACSAVLIAILFDVLTGIAKALSSCSMSSSAMRMGFFHKFGTISLLALCVFLQYACSILDLGFEPPLITAASAYLVLMECTSILENVGELNPELRSNRLFGLLSESAIQDEPKGKHAE